MGKKKQKENKDGMQIKKGDDFGQWYQELLKKSEMIEYYDVSGCYIMRPRSYFIWEQIQGFFNDRINKLGVRNCYFPLFVKQSKLQKEEDNFEGFKAEVAWVTKSGSSDLNEPLAIRPTSETVMYSYFSKWIRSHRDLPLKINQWANVVRWEFSEATPFIRAREFLWQEGHTAHATKKEADVEVLEILNLYKDVYEQLLAVPVTRGMKTEKEKFPGGLYTTTVEAYVPENGRSIQGGTSHSLGQNFSNKNMFDISYEPETKTEEKFYAWQNSWGLSTRSIGAMVLIHGDDKGLVLPPRVADTQVVIVPIISKDSREEVLAACQKLYDTLKVHFRVKLDDREDHRPGWKYNYWELRGVPLRIEVGIRDLQKGAVCFSRRDTGKKEFGIKNDEHIVESVQKTLDLIHDSMLEKARKIKDDHYKQTTDWKDFVSFLGKKNVVLVPFCGCEECEEQIKELTGEEAKMDEKTSMSAGAKSLCFPLIQGKLEDNCKCINPKCEKIAKRWCLFGRSY